MCEKIVTNELSIPVGTVCAMFGLNPNTVRTWERRYEFPSPQRSAGGHRTYSDADIELIERIVNLMDSGLSPHKAIEQARKEASNLKPDASLNKSLITRAISDIYLLIQKHDQVIARFLANKAFNELGYRVFVEQVAFPLLNQLGHSWETKGDGVAQEHGVTMIVEGLVLEHAKSLQPGKSCPVVTFACVPGEMHQLPVLHIANLAAENNIARPLVLTAGLPIGEIISASQQSESEAIFLSSTITPGSKDTREWMSEIDQAGWIDKTILAGPGFLRSRIYSDYPVRAAAGGFTQTLNALRRILS